jgi:rubrerythrin
MPRVDGFVVALTLRGLLPDVHVALHSAESTAHRERALEHRLPLFDKLHVDEAVAWVEAASLTHDRGSQKRAFECGVCGYGVVRATPPASCVMCRSEGTWVHAPWRPFAPRA